MKSQPTRLDSGNFIRFALKDNLKMLIKKCLQLLKVLANFYVETESKPNFTPVYFWLRPKPRREGSGPGRGPSFLEHRPSREVQVPGPLVQVPDWEQPAPLHHQRHLEPLAGLCPHHRWRHEQLRRGGRHACAHRRLRGICKAATPQPLIAYWF